MKNIHGMTSTGKRGSVSKVEGEIYEQIESKKAALKAAFLELVADRTGLEPATSGVTGRHSNRLNYRSAKHLN